MQHGVQNSRIEILLGVFRNLLDDIATLIESLHTLPVNKKFVVKKEILRDYAYLESRTRHEGLSFLTVTLPNLGKWYDEQLMSRDGDLIEGFKPYHHFRNEFNRTCPLFTRIYTHVLHCPGGLPQDIARVVRAYRSFFYLLYKMEVPFSDEDLSSALQKWRDNEQELEEFDFPDYYSRDLIGIRHYVSHLFAVSDECLFRDIDPRHGPGAVAGGEIGDEKWETIAHLPSLHRVYPRYDTYLALRSDGRISPEMCGELLALFKKRSVGDEAVSRLLFVPKDSRGPRTISCEPKELMFIQQGVCQPLMRLLHTRSFQRINFVDQSVNAQLALSSSESGEYATIDMQDASDRVSTTLVDLLFPDWTLKYLHALRSTSTRLPDGSLYKNHCKFAPMGSAICFPIESAIFWATAVWSGITSGLSESEALASTYVYGDDIIIRPQVFEEFLRISSSIGLKTNVRKSCVVGPFRESCGMDAWKGFDITPLKIKKDISRRSLDGRVATAVCEYASRCFALDYRKTGEFLAALAESHYPGIPRGQGVGRFGCLSIEDPAVEFDIKLFKHGYSLPQCRVWIVGWSLTTPRKPTHLDGLSRLLKNLYGSWEEHDPSQVANPRLAKIRKRRVMVDV